MEGKFNCAHVYSSRRSRNVTTRRKAEQRSVQWVPQLPPLRPIHSTGYWGGRTPIYQATGEETWVSHWPSGCRYTMDKCLKCCVHKDLFSWRLLSGKTQPRASENRYCRTRKEGFLKAGSQGASMKEWVESQRKAAARKSPQNERRYLGWEGLLEEPRTPYHDDNIQCRQKAGTAMAAKREQISGNIGKQWEHDWYKRQGTEIEPKNLRCFGGKKKRIGTKAKIQTK